MKKIKMFIFMAVFFAVFLASPDYSLAQNEEAKSIQDQIQILLKQIEELKTKLSALQGQSSQWCYNFNKNLKIGDIGEDVLALKKALDQEGFNLSGEYSPHRGSLYTPEFGEVTASVVVGFQEKYKKEILESVGLQYGTGFAGKSTRKKLNQLYGCGYKSISSSSSSASSSSSSLLNNWKTYRNEEYGFEMKYPLNVSVKNWAEETPNMSLLVNFGNNLNISDNVVSVYIEKGTSMADIETETKREDLFNNLRIEPQNIKDEKIGKDNYPAKKIDYKNESSSLDFVKYLIDNSGLLYQVNYRRKANSIITESNFNLMLSTFKFIESSTSSSLSPSSKSSSSSSSSSNSSIAATLSSVTVISPNGGEELEKGANYPIIWSAANLGNLTVSIDLVDSNGYITRNIVNNIKLDTANSGSYNWSVPQDLPEGSYKILISSFDKGPSAQDYSDSYFIVK